MVNQQVEEEKLGDKKKEWIRPAKNSFRFMNLTDSGLPETANWHIDSKEKGDKKKEWVCPTQNSFRLMRNVSTNSREGAGGWVKSRLSLYSNSSGTSGIGSISTYQSQQDLSIRPVSPIERRPKLSFLSGSMSSSMDGGNSFRSKSQRERGKSDRVQDRGTLTRERNISWTNSRLFQRMRWVIIEPLVTRG